MADRLLTASTSLPALIAAGATTLLSPLQAATRLSVDSIAAKLRRNLARSNKPAIPMATLPTVTQSTAPTLTANVKAYNILPGLTLLGSAFWFQDTPNTRMYPVAGDKTGAGTAYNTVPANRLGYCGTMDFWYDDASFELDAAFTDLRIYVYNPSTFQFEVAYTVVATTTARTNVLVSFGSKAQRQIRVETSAIGSIYNLRLASATSTIWPVSSADNISAVFMTDSYGEGGGSGTTTRLDSCFHDFGRRLGILDCRIAALGGTGILTPNAPSVSYLNRLTSDILSQPAASLYVFEGSGNDAGQTSAAITAAWGSLLDQVIAAFPNALIVVTGSWTTSGNDTTRAPVTAAIQAALATRPSVKFMDMSTWITGTGHVGAVAGDGNADFYMDGTTPFIHPYKPDGHAYRANRMAEAMKSILNTI